MLNLLLALALPAWPHHVQFIAPRAPASRPVLALPSAALGALTFTPPEGIAGGLPESSRTTLEGSPLSELAPLGENAPVERAPLGAAETAPVEASRASAADLLEKMYRREPLAERERVVIAHALDHAAHDALDPDLALTARLEAVAFLGQSGLLSVHDMRTRRLAEERLTRLRYGLSEVRMQADQALSTLESHLVRPLPDESRRFMRESVLRSKYAR